MIAGKSMIQRVWEQAILAKGLDALYVVTPDEEIRKEVENFGGKALMTSDKHHSGTDRLAEAAALLDTDCIVNIQGDEPLIEPQSITLAMMELTNNPHTQMVSLMCPCPETEWDNPACVKVVCDQNSDALYFSRSRIPFPRSANSVPVMQHIGLYAYRTSFLLRFASWKQTPLEKTESLEQLRVLEKGEKIRMVQIAQAPLSVDTPEDLAMVEMIIKNRERPFESK
jgi:3-deoxy-manno-octulosonate cytidylyltransferase (CMP-KDO synthetase)